MSLPNRYWLFNNTSNDGANTGNASGGAGASSSNWVVIDLVNDALLFLDDQQTDGDAISGTKYPLIKPESGDLEAPKTFVKDNSEAIYDQVPLAGTTNGEQDGGNTRYVFAIYFDGAIAGIPYLEAWDDSDHDSIWSPFLGGNGEDESSPEDSTLLAVSTTDAVPGSATWAGTPLAGTDSRIELDDAPLAGAQNVYFNIKQIIPSTFTALSSSDLVLALRFLYS
jgi:hypothetical protein